MRTRPQFVAHQMTTLPHMGICGIIGVSLLHQVYVEEIYPPDDAIAYHIIMPNGAVHQTDPQTPFSLSQALITPSVHPDTTALNYHGGRLRGMREIEHLSDWAQPLSVMDKMVIIRSLGLAIHAMQLFGIAYSTVLSSAPVGDDWFVVCRRIALAIALPHIQHDKNGLPYDYDTHILQTAHLYHVSHENALPVSEWVTGIGGTALHHVYDCVVYEDKLYLSSGGGDDQKNTIHQWSIEYPTQKG